MWCFEQIGENARGSSMRVDFVQASGVGFCLCLAQKAGVRGKTPIGACASASGLANVVRPKVNWL